MARVKRSRQAKRDLVEIIRHISQDNPPAASRWFDALETLFQLMASQPEIGEQVDTRRSGTVRRIPHGDYVIYYRPRAYGVFILRVFHGAQDHERRF